MLAGAGRLAIEAAHDARFGLRLLARQKAFTIAAVATLAIGIGATAAMFSLVDGVLLQPLPYHEPEQLVRIWSANPRGIPRNGIAPPDYFDWREQAQGFTSIAAFSAAEGTLTGAGDPIRLEGAHATPNLAATLGAEPLLGTVVHAGRGSRPEATVVVIGEGLWRERFGAATAIVGRTVLLDGRARTVVGVMPRTFQFPSRDARIWLPVSDAWRGETRNAHFLGAVGRLPPGFPLTPRATAFAPSPAPRTGVPRDEPRLGGDRCVPEESIVGDFARRSWCCWRRSSPSF